jgi:hypothetical protein
MSLISSYPRFASAVDALEQMNNVFAFVNSADPFEMKNTSANIKGQYDPSRSSFPRLQKKSFSKEVNDVWSIIAG